MVRRAPHLGAALQDAKKILTGGDDSVTQFFRAKTAAPVALKFLPIVKRATDRVGLAQKYDQFAGQGAKLGLVKGDAANVAATLIDVTAVVNDVRLESR